jgi:3-deoxy-D-manno-octulosonate 8-phosphate phosphatase (KDO 8-P phosphatase)
MAELGVPHVVLGCPDKVAAMDELASSLDIDVADCGYVGDDVPDLALLEHVGFSFAVANAVPEVLERCDYVTRASGGFGAVREVCDLVVTTKHSDNG